MIELVEATLIAQEMASVLAGKTIADVTHGNSPHKFAFLSGTEDEYKEQLIGQTLGTAWPHGSMILQMAGDDQVIILGEGGEKILYHETEKTWPKKRQFELRFGDGTSLTVTISGWGAARAMSLADVDDLPYFRPGSHAPLDPEFTPDYWQAQFIGHDEGKGKAIKYFVISEPGILGVGNGYLQDILFHAGIHPRTKVPMLTEGQRMDLYRATVETMQTALAQGGRTTEWHIDGSKGGYARLMDSKTKGKPCPVCGTPIEKISFLGGACYLCPRCQPLT